MRNHQFEDTPCAFTLIELLVVVAIIALLLGILVPSLSKARDTGRRAVCGANMRSAMMGTSVYMAQYNGWIPGPFTTGTMWNLNGPGNILSGPTDSVDATANHGKDFPFQNEDWVSPTLGESMSMPDKDLDRAFSIYNSKLRCPSNYIVANDFFSGPAPTQSVYFPSYGACLSWSSWPTKENAAPVQNPTIRSTTVFSEILPADYVPRLDHVGNLSQKVLLIEGSRYVDPANPSDASLNFARYQIQGGGLMVAPPTEPFANTPWDIEPITANPSIADATLLRRFAARHGSGSDFGMNLAFFDNHVEYQKRNDFTALNLYFPPGTRSNNNASHHFDPSTRSSSYVVP